MSVVVTVHGRGVPVARGATLLAALRDTGIYLPAPCGGNGTCGKCRVRVAAGTLPPAPEDEALFSAPELAAGWRLACRARPEADITIELPDTGEAEITAVTGFAGTDSGAAPRGISDPSAEKSWTVAVDIGTTTLGFALVDAASGAVAGRLSLLNRQRQYGADVISRIVRANAGDLPAMRDLIRAQLSEGIAKLCAAHGVNAAKLTAVAVAGNTTMQHILMGQSCAGLGVSPFTPVSVALQTLPAGALPGVELSPGCDVYVLPGISTFVGADISCGILLTGLHKTEAPALLLDIGTNGEMALGYKGGILCTSTAAGPAFEGGNIAWGTGSVPGAISRVKAREGGGFQIETIADEPPVGICGSGVIDAVHACLQSGLVDETGRMADECADGGIELAKTPEGQSIVLTQKDVREVQLAKSAVRTGIDLLLRRAGLAYAEIDVMHLAGGFGYTIGIESAVGIGLLPGAMAGKAKVAGNASLGGAAAWLRGEPYRCELAAIAGQAEEFNLSEDPNFNDLFIDNMIFE